MKEAQRIAPDLLREMWMPPQQMRQMMAREGIFDQELAAFRADGPILSAHMQAFAAKIGFALHYEATGSFVPPEGRVQVRWFASAQVYGGRLPTSLLSSIGAPRTMQQGKITSDGSFEYGCRIINQTRRTIGSVGARHERGPKGFALIGQKAITDFLRTTFQNLLFGNACQL